MMPPDAERPGRTPAEPNIIDATSTTPKSSEIVASATTGPNGKVHPAADVFPMLGDDEMGLLVESIRADGLQHPIVLLPDGTLLDGRNRLKACEVAGVVPIFTTFDGADAAGFVLRANVTRRHMTTGQRAMATAMVLAADGKRVNGRWKRGSVPRTPDSGSKAWANAMAQAGAVLDTVPQHAPLVAAALMTLDVAHLIAKRVASDEGVQESNSTTNIVDSRPSERVPNAGAVAKAKRRTASGPKVRRKHLQIFEAVAASLDGMVTALEMAYPIDDSVSAADAGRISAEITKLLRQLSRCNARIREASR